jgi:hypothetical protein
MDINSFSDMQYFQNSTMKKDENEERNKWFEIKVSEYSHVTV